MKILEYEYRDPVWHFNTARFQDVNLIVGDSGSGKTRLFNTLFNLGSGVFHGRATGSGQRILSLGLGKDEYKWDVAAVHNEDLTIQNDEPIIIESEKLYKNGELIIERNLKGFSLPTGMPKPKKGEYSISIFREETDIRPLFDGFSKMQRRRFFSGELEKNAAIIAIDESALRRIGKKKDLFEVYKNDLALNPKLYILSQFFPKIYKKIIEMFLDTFHFIDRAEMKFSNEVKSLDMMGRYPVFCIKEKNIKSLLRLDELSSGMQKTLIILTDLFSLPKGSVYLLDEYENSLGVSAINILPDVLLAEDLDLQLFVTSHHPTIIPKFSISNWYLAHRKGGEVVFEHGESLLNRFNLSAQDKYFQLFNDPYFNEGIE